MKVRIVYDDPANGFYVERLQRAGLMLWGANGDRGVGHIFDDTTRAFQIEWANMKSINGPNTRIQPVDDVVLEV
jgi:hypothetical protein